MYAIGSLNMMKGQAQTRNHWLKGLAAGLAGGLVASVVMNRFQESCARLTADSERSHGAQSLQRGSPGRGVARELRKRGSDEQQDDAAVRIAGVLSEGVFHHALTEREKAIAGTASHYVFGVAAGGVYGVLADLEPRVTTGGGLPFGAFIWVAADEGVVPALGLSKPLTGYPLRTHIYSIAAHLMFGLTAEAVRRGVRKIL